MIAHHLLRSEPIDAPWAPVALEASAPIAITRGDPNAAVAYLRRALEERPDALTRGETLRSLGNALARLGDPAAVDVLGEALELTRRPSIRAEIVDESIDLLLARGRTDDAAGCSGACWKTGSRSTPSGGSACSGGWLPSAHGTTRGTTARSTSCARSSPP